MTSAGALWFFHVSLEKGIVADYKIFQNKHNKKMTYDHNAII